MDTNVSGTVPSRTWTAQEIADHVGIAVRTVWYEIDCGNLIAHKLGHRVMVYQDDLVRWLYAKPYTSTPKVQGRGGNKRRFQEQRPRASVPMQAMA